MRRQAVAGAGRADSYTAGCGDVAVPYENAGERRQCVGEVALLTKPISMIRSLGSARISTMNNVVTTTYAENLADFADMSSCSDGRPSVDR
jgi:hypothetical protein